MIKIRRVLPVKVFIATYSRGGNQGVSDAINTGVPVSLGSPVPDVSRSTCRVRHLRASTADHASSTDRTAIAVSVPEVRIISDMIQSAYDVVITSAEAAFIFGPGRRVPKSHSSCCCCYQFSKNP